MLDRLRRMVSAGLSTAPAASADAAAPFAVSTTFTAPDLGDWYAPVIIGADVVGRSARADETLGEVIALLERITPDPYVKYLLAFYSAGRERFGDDWGYADITTVLMAAGRLVRPARYLEIGVRRGRSMAVVASTNPDCSIVGFDIWYEDYAGIENPGPEFVRSEMASVGHRGSLDLVVGDSHETVPRYLAEHPTEFFDLVTVDGDHRLDGAAQDLKDVMERVSIGGVLVFDDTRHPAHPGLDEVWERVVKSDRRFSTWHYDDVGYGVAAAVRRT